MEKLKLAISSMHALVNGFCKENSLDFSQKTFVEAYWFFARNPGI
jgi:hypothetical protein